MSCPYLEKGKMAYCHAFGGQRLMVDSSESEAVCFSGDFSECSFLFLALSVGYEKNKGQRNFIARHPKTYDHDRRIESSRIGWNSK